MLEIGTMLSGRYEVLKRVGSGGMADVYMAKDHKLNRNVAVKVLKSEYVEDEKFLKKFETEAQAVARLSHPNIVNVYDVGIEDGINYIVMELAEGMTLKEYIRRKGYLSPKETVEISLQIASAISHAHKNHIIHRDIKPQNILISREGKVKVTEYFSFRDWKCKGHRLWNCEGNKQQYRYINSNSDGICALHFSRTGKRKIL